MTSIAYRNGILAADTAIWSGGVIVAHQRKVAKLDGYLFGAAGDPGAVQRFLKDGFAAWTGGRMLKVTDQGFVGLVIRPDGSVLRMTEHGEAMEALPADWHAIGRCADFLIGAMAANAHLSAPEAIRLAIKWTDSAAGDVHVERIG
jgi:hypothetical protein